jgi:hypothetical protein
MCGHRPLGLRQFSSGIYSREDGITSEIMGAGYQPGGIRHGRKIQIPVIGEAFGLNLYRSGQRSCPAGWEIKEVFL